MSQNRTIKAILALEYDKRALSGTQKAIDQLNASLDSTRKRALTVETAASGLKKELAELARQDAVDQIGRDFARAGEEGREFNAAVRETVARLQAVGASEAEIRGVARAYQDAAAAANQAAAATANVQASQATRGALGVLGSNIKGLPALQISGNFSTDAIGKILQVVDAGLLKLGPAGIAAGVGVVGFGLVMSEFVKNFTEYTQKIEERAKAFFEGLNDITQQIFEGATSEDIQKQINDQERARDATRQQIDELTALQQQYSALTEGAGDTGILGVTDLGERVRAINDAQQLLKDATGGQVETIEAVEAALKILDTQLTETEAGLFVLNDSLSNTQVAANDAAASYALALTSISNTLQARSEIEADTYQFLENATKEQAEKRIQTAQDEVDRLTALNVQLALVGGDTATALIAANQARIDEQILIRDTTQALIGLTGSNALQGFFDQIKDNGRGIFESAINAVGGAFGGLIDGAINQVDRLGDIQQKITDAENKTSAAISAINAKLAETEAKALADRDQGLADAQEKYNDAREKQEIAHRDRLLAINQRANVTQANAVGARDALAFFLAQQQRKTELKEENLANKRRLSEIDKALKQQTDQVIRRYNEQVEVARKVANAAIAIENEKLRVLQTQLNAEITAINAANQQRLALQASYWNASIATDVAGANSALSVISQFWNGVLSTVSGDITHSSTPIIPNVVPYDGSSTPSTDYSGLSTFSSSPNTSRYVQNSISTQNDAGITVNVNGLGMTDTQVSMKVQRELNRTLKAARQQQLRTAT
jgi:hypothetical protein